MNCLRTVISSFISYSFSTSLKINSSWLTLESMKALELRTSMLFNLVFAYNTILCFFFFLIIYLYFLIPAVTAQIFNPIAKLIIPRNTNERSKSRNKIPLDETHLVAVRGLIHQEVPAKVCQRRELNWASQLKLSGQQIFSTIMPRPESTLIRQDYKGLL